MSDCCGSSNGFPTASLMEQMATNQAVIWEEICKIQQGILSASSQCQVGGGQLCTNIGGNTPMTFVASVLSASVTHGGSGYVQDTPSLVIVPPYNAMAGGAVLTPVISNSGEIQSVTVADGGAGYYPISSSIVISTNIGTGAEISPVVDASGRIIAVNIAAGGIGYTLQDTLIPRRAVAPSSLFIDAVLQISSIGSNGSIASIAVVNQGTGYQQSVPTVAIVSGLDATKPYPAGTGFTATATTDQNGAISTVNVVTPGAGYLPVGPYMVITDPGFGATSTVTIASGSITGVQITNGGTNYTSSASATVYNPPSAALPNPPTDHAVVSLSVNSNTYGTDPTQYYQVFAGTLTNQQIQNQINAVMVYFKNLGYTISIITNPSTGNTFMWRICW